MADATIIPSNSQPCVFCAVPYSQVRYKSPTRVWNELNDLVRTFRADYIYETSDSLCGNISWLEQLAEAKSVDLSFEIFSRADEITPRSVELLKKIGVSDVFIGMESGSDEILKTINKRFDSIQSCEAVKLLDVNGMKVSPSFIVGLPGESEESLEQTYELSHKIKQLKNYGQTYKFIFNPIPGSRAFSELIQQPDLREKLSASDLFDYEELKMEWIKRKCKVSYDRIRDVYDTL